MNKNQEKQLNKEIREQMQKVRDSGLLAGSKAICGVVLEKAKDSTKTEHEKLQDIIEFCERSLGVANRNEGVK